MLDLVSKCLDRPHALEAPLKDALVNLPPRCQGELREITVTVMKFRRATEEAREPCSPESSEDETEADTLRTDEADGVNLVNISKQVEALSFLPEFEGFGLFSKVALT